jgi:hypothetical protein
MPKITDPTNLAQTTSVLFNYASATNRTIDLASNDISGSSLILPTVSGSNTGVTLQALYSFCKEQWKSDANLIKIPFPLISITKNQFDFINNWTMANNRSNYLIRDAGWSIRSGSANTSVQEWDGIVTLGSLALTDQVYYLQSASGIPQNFQMAGTVNQAVLTYSASSAAVAFDSRSFMKLFVRTWQRTYSNASVQTDLQVPTMDYTVYSLPLTNAPDLAITEPVSASVTGSPYNQVTIKYLSGSYFGGRSPTTLYAAGTVVSGSDNRWYITNAGGTTSAGAFTQPTDGTVTWVSYAGERQIGSAYYPFNIIVDDGAGQNNTIEDTYTRIQYLLRLSTNIDNGTDLPARRGDTADSLARFLGSTLITANGVYIDNFQNSDTNSIQFLDVSGSTRVFPFVATGQIVFNSNLTNDPSASFFMFFTDPDGVANGNEYGTPGAIIVLNNSSLPITGSVGGSGSYSFTFDYDNNVQGGRTVATDTPVTVVAIGLATAQYVVATSTITRSKTNNISLVSTLERNFTA